MKILQPQAIPAFESTFSRASYAWAIGPDGNLLYSDNNVFRLAQDGLPMVEPEATNLARYSQQLNLAPWAGNVSVTYDGVLFYRGGPGFWTLAKTTAVGSETLAQGLGSVGAGNQLTLTLALLAGTSAVCAVGFYNDVDGWGGTETTTEILEGPGVPVDGGFGPGLPSISGLHPTIPTLVRLTRTFLSASTFGLYLYPDGALSTTVGASIKATRVQVEAGARATSYMDTGATTRTRAADVLTTGTAATGSAGGAGILYTSAGNYWPEWTASTWPPETRRTRNGSLYQVAAGVTATASNVPGSAPTVWLRVGPTNKLAQFDGEISSRTYSNELLVLRTRSWGTVVSIGAANAVLMTDIDKASTVHLQVTDGLYGAVVADQVWTAAPGQRYVPSQVLLSGFNVPSGNGVLRVGLLAPAGETPALGLLAWGQTQELGCTEWGARAGIKDYSRKEADEFGQVVFVRRAFSKTVSATVEVLNPEINTAHDRLANLRASPAVWIFSDDPAYSVPLVVYGFYKDFYATFPRLNSTQFALEIEGLT